MAVSAAMTFPRLALGLSATGVVAGLEMRALGWAVSKGFGRFLSRKRDLSLVLGDTLSSCPEKKIQCI